MQEIKVLIVEDQALIAESLKSMLIQLRFQVTGMYASGTELLQNYREGMADVILMDVNLAHGTNGIDTSKRLGQQSNIPIIYLTEVQDDAARKKAIRETNAVAYLSKPFNIADVNAAIELAVKNLDEKPVKLLEDSIFFKDGFSYYKIKLADIFWIKAAGAYCIMHCEDRDITFSYNLNAVSNKLASVPDLIRVHRSYIINARHIDKIQEGRIWVNGEEIALGGSYRDAFFSKFRFF